MYKHILVTVAYDEGHDAAPSLQVARNLADVGAQISLIHVMDPPPSFAISYLPDGWREDMRNAIEADLLTLAGAGKTRPFMSSKGMRRSKSLMLRRCSRWIASSSRHTGRARRGCFWGPRPPR